MADRPVDETINVVIQDDDLDELAINSDGSLNAAAVIASVPAGATSVVKENFADISTTSGTDTTYTITNTKTLTIQAFSAGSESSVGGSVTELFEDPNGDLSVLNRISTLFTDGSSSTVPLAQSYAGDGTRRIVVRQRGYTAAAREMFSSWRGYEE
jgi:hypothetical protein